MPAAIGVETLVNTTTGGDQHIPQIARLAGGGFVVVWQDNSGAGGDASGYSIKAQRYDSSGAKVGPEWLVNGNTTGDQYEPKLAGLASGGFVVTWTDTTGDPSGWGVKARLYDASGVPIGPEFLVNTLTGDDQWQPVPEALPGGGFVITWAHRSGDSSLYAVKGQIFDATGAKTGGEFLVNTVQSSYQDNGKVSALAGGGFVVVWNDISHVGGDFSGYGVKGQIFDGAGTKVGGEFLVNTNTAGDQAVTNRSVSALSSGGFVVAWESNDPSADGSGYALKAQLFDASGSKVGGEFLVNTNTAGHQLDPVTLALPGGGFLISWADSTGDASGYAVKGQLFDSAGNRVGGEFLINSTTVGDQLLPMVAGFGSGFAVVWSDNSGVGGDPSAFGIKLQLFSIANVINGTPGDDTLFGTNGDDVINGLGGNDQIFGLPGHDVLNGDDGNDLISGGQGNDTIHGGNGNDNLNGGGGDDTIYGDDGEDILFGQAGNDTLYGGAGYDFLRGDPQDGLTPGNDYIDAGAGFDRVTYYNTHNAVTVSLLLQGTPQNTGQGMDTLVNVEGITGSVFSDTLIGDDNDNWFFFGGAGVDHQTVTSDTISGNGGNDLIVVGMGNHNVAGGAGVDTLAFDWLHTEIAGGVTVDLALQGGAQNTGQGSMTIGGFENLSGTLFDDVLRGDTLANALAGSAGADQLYGGAGNDTLLGDGEIVMASINPAGAGPITTYTERADAATDFYDSSGQLVYLFVGQDLYDSAGHQLPRTDLLDDDGNPYSRFTLNSVDYDLYVGDATASDGVLGSDILDGGDGDDTLIAGAGNDTLIGGAGTDSLDGGSGIDTVSYWNAAGAVDLNLQFGFADEYSADGVTYLTTDSLVSIEYAIGSAFDDALTGSAGDNYLDGAGGGDIIQGRGGNDQVNGGDGDDILSGDFGIAVLTGGGNDLVDGGNGNDSVRGRDGNDIVLGGSGNDFVEGGTGDDIVDGGAGFDRAAFYSMATAGVHVDLNIQGVAQDTGQGMDTLIGIENLSGSQFNDVLIGNGGDNWILAGLDGESDTVSGNGGNDLIEVGAGTHTLSGGAGIDTWSLFGNVTSVGSVGMTVSLALQGGAQNTGQGMMNASGFENLSGSIYGDRLTGDAFNNLLAGDEGADVLNGGDGNDTLYGDGRTRIDFQGTGGSGPITTWSELTETFGSGAGNDILDGGKGNDTLLGGAGDDVLTGGAGIDRFEFGAGSGHDRITDFAKKDVIAFTAGPHSFAELTLTAVGKDTLLTWGTGDSILVEGTKPNKLSAADFSFESPAAASAFAAANFGPTGAHVHFTAYHEVWMV